MQRKAARIAILLLCMGTLSACTDWARNLYEGIRLRQESTQSPSDRATQPRKPSYDEYQKEREKL